MFNIGRNRWPWLGLISWCGIIAVVAYGSALHLTFVTDDWTQLPYAAARTITEIWQGAKGPAYYRPLAFTVWKALHGVLGRHDDVALHALNLGLHVLNSLMVGWLAGRLWNSSSSGKLVNWWRRYLAAGLYLLFPFSYDAIAWIAAMMHPLVIALVLASITSYLKARETGAKRWIGLSLGLTLLSPFAHEYGVLAGPLCMAIEFTWPQTPEGLWRRLRRAAPWLIPALIWWLIWRGIPVSRGAGWLALNGGSTLWRNSVYFMQGAAYPITWSGNWLSANLAIDNVTVAVMLAIIALSGAVLIQWCGHSDRRAWLPWLWLTLTSAPAVLFLDYKYVSSSPRMLMLMSVGAAWLWADILVRLSGRGRTTLMRHSSLIVTIFLATALFLQNVAYIRDRLWPWELGGSMIRQVAERTAMANAGGQQAVFINLPAWMSSAQVVYAMGQEGLMLLPAYFSLDSIVSLYTGQTGRASSIKHEAIRLEVPYYIGLRDSTTDWAELAASGGEVFVTQYFTDAIQIEPVGEFKIVRPSPLIANFGAGIQLRTAEANRTARGVQLALTWEVTQPLMDDVTVFVHVLDADGQLIAQADGDPLAGTYPFEQWPINVMVRDIRLVRVANAAAVRVGVYSRSTGERLPAVSTNHVPLADNAVTVEIR